MRDRRIGKFQVNLHEIHECPDRVRAAMRDMIVLRAECLDYARCYEYIAIHPSFAVCPEGSIPPTYSAEIKTKGDGTIEHVRWVRCS